MLSPVSFLLTVWKKGEFVGEDQAGNRYFRGPARKTYTHDRRWVIYQGEPDASKVPPEWHGWLHHQTNIVPSADAMSFRKPWQTAHRPNLTGTDMAYRPQGHQLMGGQRPKATGDYQPWKPE